MSKRTPRSKYTVTVETRGVKATGTPSETFRSTLRATDPKNATQRVLAKHRIDPTHVKRAIVDGREVAL